MNYSELKDLWRSWAHRTDLTDTLLDQITALVNARLGRDLRCQQNEVTVDLVVGVDGVALPLDYRDLRYVTVDKTSGKRALIFMTPAQYNHRQPSGSRFNYTIEAGQLITGQATVHLTYWQLPPDLVVTLTNDVLTAWPNLYLYAGLVEIARHFQDLEGANALRQQYLNELAETNAQGSSARIGNSPVMRAG